LEVDTATMLDALAPMVECGVLDLACGPVATF